MINKNILETVPQDAKEFHSESGGMTKDVFFECMQELYSSWLAAKGYEKVVLTMDGQTSHISLKVSEFAKEKNITLLWILTKATHLLQPLDVGIFKNLKNNWKKHADLWTKGSVDEKGNRVKIINSGPPKVVKMSFCQHLSYIIRQTMTPERCKNAFRKSGIFQ